MKMLYLDKFDPKFQNFHKWELGTYNPGHNILEPYNILVNVGFTTSKTKLDI